MATSGTVATTTIDTAKLIEHAVRRCKIPTAQQTPELISSAKESLFILLLSLASRGINLWCVEKQLIGLGSGQATYVTNPGTIDILNVVYSQPTRVTGTDTAAADSITTELDSATSVVRIGLKFSTVDASGTLTLSSSTDGVVFTSLLTSTKTDWSTGKWYWFDIPVVSAATYYKASLGTSLVTTEFYLASSVYDLPVSQWNRDSWVVINNKNQTGSPSTSYYLEKLRTPQLTLWPVPNSDYNHLSLTCHRQIQDVGTLTQEMDIPGRWYEGIIWQLALRVAFEAPDVDPARLQVIVQMAQQYLLEAEYDETDGAPISISPGIGVYTR